MLEMATRVGRGRSRGGRVLDVSTTIPARGRGFMGRGMASFDPQVLRNSVQQNPMHSFSNVGDTEAKENLESELTSLVQTLQGSVIHMTLKYFNSSSDTQFYIDKVVEHLLRSPFFIEKFTMSYKLITVIQTHGESIKRKMFTKLQTTFKDVQLLMTDSDNLSKTERERVRNFCELLGQLYFRLRVAVDSLERYDILSMPVLQCLAYLIRAKGRHELKLFSKLLALNLSALNAVNPGKVADLKMEVRRGLYDGVEDCKELAWLMFALEMLSLQDRSVELDGAKFYEEVLQQDWAEVPKGRVELLADIPADILDSQMDKFNISFDDYLKQRYVALWVGSV